MNGVVVERLRKSYGSVTAVDDISFEVEPGEFLTLLGPSGCGKTTSLRMVAGFVLPDQGRISIDGQDVTNVPPHNREIGLVFQSYALFPHMSVFDNVAFGLKMRGLPKAEVARLTAEALEMVKLTELVRRLPRQLSGGQQQRVALARALVIKPKVLLLDEPFGALDKQLREHMRAELRSLQQRLGVATVFVTHDQEEALSLSDRVAVMNDGRIEQIGAPHDLYERPATLFVAEFLGRSNIVEIQSIQRSGPLSRLASADLAMDVSSDLVLGAERAIVTIRPERIRLMKPNGATNPGVNEGEIVSFIYLGASVVCGVRTDSGRVLEVAVANAGEDGFPHFPVGTRVSVHFLAGAVHVLGQSRTREDRKA